MMTRLNEKWSTTTHTITIGMLCVCVCVGQSILARLRMLAKANVRNVQPTNNRRPKKKRSVWRHQLIATGQLSITLFAWPTSPTTDVFHSQVERRRCQNDEYNLNIIMCSCCWCWANESIRFDSIRVVSFRFGLQVASSQAERDLHLLEWPLKHRRTQKKWGKTIYRNMRKSLIEVEALIYSSIIIIPRRNERYYVLYGGCLQTLVITHDGHHHRNDCKNINKWMDVKYELVSATILHSSLLSLFIYIDR